MGVRQLTEADRERTLRFLEEESALNLFLIGDIHNYGFDKEFQQLWGDFDGDGDLRGVLLRYRGSWIPYAPGPFDVEGFARVIRAGREAAVLSGIDRVTEPFRGMQGLPFRWENKRRTHFARLTESTELDRMEKEVSSLPVRPMTLKDVPTLARLSEHIVEFESADREEELRASLKSGDARGYWAEDGGCAVAMARTAAENPASAMVVGVGTHPSYRQAGLATQLMIRLCRELLKEGKSLCLFYDNPRAGAIYRRLGFREIGYWDMIRV